MITTLLADLANQNVDAPVYVAQNVAFGIIAALMIFSAIRVVTTSNVVHAAAFLVMVLAGAAAQFILLGAEFVAITQVMVYIGAIVVLFLFGIMLTRAPMKGEEHVRRDQWMAGLVTGLVVFGVMIYALIDGFGTSKIPEDLMPTDTGVLSDSLYGGYLLAFEAISLLLLSAAVGAIVVSKRD